RLRDLHSFPARRSSDLIEPHGAVQVVYGERNQGYARLHETLLSAAYLCPIYAPVSRGADACAGGQGQALATGPRCHRSWVGRDEDRKSTRLNSSHPVSS